jgi:hypothetical protein
MLPNPCLKRLCTTAKVGKCFSAPRQWAHAHNQGGRRGELARSCRCRGAPLILGGKGLHYRPGSAAAQRPPKNRGPGLRGLPLTCLTEFLFNRVLFDGFYVGRCVFFPIRPPGSLFLSIAPQGDLEKSGSQLTRSPCSVSAWHRTPSVHRL